MNGKLNGDCFTAPALGFPVQLWKEFTHPAGLSKACPSPTRPWGKLTFSVFGLRLLLPLLLLELHVAEVHDGAHYFIAAVLLFIAEAQDVHGMLRGDRQ